MWAWFVDKGFLEYQEQLNEVARELAIRFTLQFQ
jgi:hypothetical protein